MIKELSSLRGILILFIFFHHRGVYDGAGAMAVACFFVLGGFCSALGYADKVTRSDFHYGRYLVSRLIKYYPLHWLLLAVYVVWGGHIALRYLMTNAFLLQSWVPIQSYYFSFNAASWYLSDVVFFVWMCPWVLRCLCTMSDRKLWLSLMGVCVIGLVLAMCVPMYWHQQILYINPLTRLLDFIVGAISAMLYTRNKDRVKITNAMYWIVASLSFVILVVLSIFLPKELRLVPFFFWPFSALLILALSFGTKRMKGLSHPLLVKLGECSFSFYMVHLMCIEFFGFWLRRAGLSSHALISVALLFITMIVAYLLRTYFEIPVSKWLKSTINRQFTTAQS